MGKTTSTTLKANRVRGLLQLRQQWQEFTAAVEDAYHTGLLEPFNIDAGTTHAGVCPRQTLLLTMSLMSHFGVTKEDYPLHELYSLVILETNKLNE